MSVGHLRVGRLPKTRRWDQVIGLLDVQPDDVQGVAGAVAVAAERQLREFGVSVPLSYCFWVLARLTAASRGDFVGELQSLGLPSTGDTPTIAFIAHLADRVRRDLADELGAGHVSELAALSLRRALTDTVALHGQTLFGSSVADLQAAFRMESSGDQFGAISQRFFGDFLARTLRSFVDRELTHRVSAGEGLSNLQDAQAFSAALDTYARESARIVRDFGRDWYAKRTFPEAQTLTFDDARNFTAVAMRKLRSELKLGTV